MAIERPSVSPGGRWCKDARAAFARDGYYGPIRVLSEAAAEACRRRLEALIAAHPAAAARLDQKSHLLAPWLDRLVRHPAMLDVAESLFGPDLLCESSAFRRKLPGPGHAGWHQDTMYIKIAPIVTFWLAFTASTPRAGGLRYIPGSHTWPLLAHRDTDDADSLLTRGQHITEPFDSAGARDAVLGPGEAAIFHHNLVHSSGPNRSAAARILHLIGYCPTRAVNDGPRASATLVRGADRYGHFDREPRPRGEMSAAALAAHRRAVTLTARTLFKDATRAPKALV